MGISLALFQVDHENVVVRGLPVLNRALQTGDLGPLRQLLKDLPFDESEQLVEYFQKRVARLRKVGAPAVIIANEERRFASVRAPSPEAIDRASLEELREMLGAWCREARSVDLDKAWDLVHWYSDARRRAGHQGDWRERSADGPPSPLGCALHGHEPYPKDITGRPVIRTGGSVDMSSYNPPDIVTEIATTIEQVSPEAWEQIDREMKSIAERDRPYAGNSQDRMEYAREAFVRFAEFYRVAARRNFGVSVEFY